MNITIKSNGMQALTLRKIRTNLLNTGVAKSVSFETEKLLKNSIVLCDEHSYSEVKSIVDSVHELIDSFAQFVEVKVK